MSGYKGWTCFLWFNNHQDLELHWRNQEQAQGMGPLLLESGNTKQQHGTLFFIRNWLAAEFFFSFALHFCICRYNKWNNYFKATLCLYSRPMSQSGRPVSGFVRPGTQSGRPGTMEQAIRTPRTAQTARCSILCIGQKLHNLHLKKVHQKIGFCLSCAIWKFVHAA